MSHARVSFTNIIFLNTAAPRHRICTDKIIMTTREGVLQQFRTFVPMKKFELQNSTYIFIFGTSHKAAKLHSITFVARHHRTHTTAEPGPPGAGKGTLCRMLAADEDFALLKPIHFSVGDCPRTRKREGTLPESILRALESNVLSPARDLVDLLTEEVEKIKAGTPI